jgi:hypothetical protein
MFQIPSPHGTMKHVQEQTRHRVEVYSGFWFIAFAIERRHVAIFPPSPIAGLLQSLFQGELNIIDIELAAGTVSLVLMISQQNNKHKGTRIPSGVQRVMVKSFEWMLLSNLEFTVIENI